MKVSFLVTYYQQARFVRESLDSILALEKPAEWEILIGDDGSADGTLAEIQPYLDRDPERIRLFVMDRDPSRKYNAVERASLNRLNLVSHASGDCYTLMDGDDFYSEKDFILPAVSLLESHPEVSVVACDTWYYTDGSPVRRKKGGGGKPRPVSTDHYLRWRYTHAGACLFRNFHTRENLDLLRSLAAFDDNDIVLNALGHGGMFRLPRPVYAYRQTAGSVYASMPPAERAALNVPGIGVGLKVMGGTREKAILARYATAVWMAWFLRDSLPGALDPGKYQSYLDICRRADFAEGEKLLRYPELDAAGKREIRKWVHAVGRQSPVRVAYAFLQTRR